MKLCVGDSILEGIEPGLTQHYGVVVNAKVGRRPDEGLDVLSEHKRLLHTGGHLVYLMLGTNGGWERTHSERLLHLTKASGQKPNIVWVTTIHGVSWASSSNAELHRLSLLNRRAHLLDWALISQGQDWFREDGYHPDTDGLERYEHLVKVVLALT